MQLGICLPHAEIGLDPSAIRDFAQAVEEIGYSYLTLTDHVLGADPDRPGGWQGIYDKDDPFQEPLVTLGYLAAVTSRIALVTSILVLPQRQTVLVAKQAAQLDRLSGGRHWLGVGVGWNPVEFEGLGAEFGDRGKRIDEQIELLRLLWTRDSVDFQGKWHQVSRAGINPRPARPIPIWIGGSADAVLRRVARLADGWMPGATIWGPDDKYKAARETLLGYLEAEGRDPESLPIQGTYPPDAGTASPDSWRAFAETWRKLGATHLPFSTEGVGFSGLDEHIAAARGFFTAVSG